jgi:hypothetical protein
LTSAGGPPAENSGWRQDDLHTGGEGGRPRLGSWARLIAVPFRPDQRNELLRQASFGAKGRDAFLWLGTSH